MSQMNFYQQRNRLFAKRVNDRWSRILLSSSYRNSAYGADIKDILGASDFADFAREAYSSGKGYSIRTNPLTGEKEMFVAGSRSVGDWILNVYDGAIYGAENVASSKADAFWDDSKLPKNKRPKLSWADPFRKYGEWRLGRIARREGVDVVYGHSRGGALVADMNVGNAKKIGLDSAMWIATNKELDNYNQGGDMDHPFQQSFDAAIGLTGKKNHTLNLGDHFHHAWD